MKSIDKLTCAALASLLLALSIPSASTSAYGGRNDYLTDWSQFSLSDLSPIAQDGSIGDEYNAAVGYDLSRSWKAGDTAALVFKLGDLSQSLAPQQLQVGQIVALGGLDLSQVSLDNFPLLARQNLKQLAQAVPNLSKLPVKKIPPVAQLVKKFLPAHWEALNLPLNQLLKGNSKLANLTLESIDLSNFTLEDIPNVDQAVLEDFADWQSAFIEEIPGLAQVPLGAMPIPVAAVGDVVARVDQIWSQAESKRNQTISGSYNEGFAVACEQECAHIELDDLENEGAALQAPFEGRQWISGKYQKVKGGSGCLAGINGGREPTGRHPYGEAFKVAVWEPEEGSDVTSTALFFKIDSLCGSSPYILGPFPWHTYQRDDLIFVGVVESLRDNQSSTTEGFSSAAEPTEALSGTPATTVEGLPTSVVASPNPSSNSQSLPPLEVAGVLIEKMEEVLGRYSEMTVGTYTCDQKCGRTLGKYQIPSDDPRLVATVSKVSGGQKWLQKLAKGSLPNEAEMMRYFPPEVQKKIFTEELTALIEQTAQETDPRTEQLFEGDRLVERVAQKWFGGIASQVDSRIPLRLGSETLAQRSRQVRSVMSTIPSSLLSLF